MSRQILNLTASRSKKTNGKRTVSKQKTNQYSGNKSNVNSSRQSLPVDITQPPCFWSLAKMLTCVFTYPWIHTLTCVFTHSPHSCFHTLTQVITHLLMYLYTHSCIHTLTRVFTHSLISSYHQYSLNAHKVTKVIFNFQHCCVLF